MDKGMIQASLKTIKLKVDSAAPDHLQLARQIEQLIRSGKLKAGERLPPTPALVKLWGLHISQIQRAMEILTRQGIVQRFPRRGTFVTSDSSVPSIGILVGLDLLQEQSHFYRVLVAAISQEIKKQGFEPRLYDVLNVPDSHKKRRSREDLDYDLRHQRFNGYVMIGSSYMEKAFKFLDKEAPMATFGLLRPAIDVAMDEYDFAFQSVCWLAEKGYRKIALVHFAPGKEENRKQPLFKGFRNSMETRGMSLPAHAIANVCSLSKVDANNQAPDRAAYEGMLKTLERWRRHDFQPDAIVVTDDIVTRGVAVALQSLLASGQPLPAILTRTVEGVGHFYALPVARYEVSATELAEKLVARVIAKRAEKGKEFETELVRGKIVEAYR